MINNYMDMIKDTIRITDPVEAGMLISRWEMIRMARVTG
jgi:hypothetical protein